MDYREYLEAAEQAKFDRQQRRLDFMKAVNFRLRWMLVGVWLNITIYIIMQH